MDTVIDYIKSNCGPMLQFYLIQGLIEAMASAGATTDKTAWTVKQVNDFQMQWLNEALRLLKEEGKDVD